MFEAGTFAGEWVVDRPLSLIRNDGKIVSPDLNASDSWCAAFSDELRAVAASLQDGAPAGALDAQAALDALEICYAEAKSIESGRVCTV